MRNAFGKSLIFVMRLLLWLLNFTPGYISLCCILISFLFYRTSDQHFALLVGSYVYEGYEVKY